MNSRCGSLFDLMEAILNDAKYSRVDKVNFLKAVFRKIYFVHS